MSSVGATLSRTSLLVACFVVGVAATASADDCPEFVANVHRAGDAQGVAGAGGFAYLAAYDDGIWIIDVESPASPVPEGAVDMPGRARAVAFSGSYVLVADDDRGLAIFRQCGVWIFTDSFESGDTSAWSAAMP